jgi:hypothetical protein
MSLSGIPVTLISWVHILWQYVTALRKAGLLEKLRAAREAMNAMFPLTSSMWREWCQDEARLASW